MPTLHINSQTLLTAVKQASGLIVPNPVVPIVENLLLQVEAQQLTLHSSNLEANLTVVVPLPSLQLEPFSICLPAKLLQATLQNLPSQPITLEVDPDTHRAVVRAGKGRFQLAGEDTRDWPRPAASKMVTQLRFAGPVLTTALLAGAPFASADKVRPEMASVPLELREDLHLRALGCDGHRIAWHSFDFTENPGPLPYTPGRYMLPQAVAKQLALLCQKAEMVTVQLGDWLLATPDSGEWSLSCRLVEGRYPDYENVIPLSNPNVLVVDRSELQQSLKRVAAFANTVTSQIGFHLSEGSPLRIWSENMDTGQEASDEAAAEYRGEELQIGFNSKYLEGCLAVLPDGPVHIEMSTPNRAARMRAAVVEPGGAFTEVLLMPVVLNNYIAA